MIEQGGTDRLRCSQCEQHGRPVSFMRIRSSKRISRTSFARMECTKCGHVVNATIVPSEVVSVRDIKRRTAAPPVKETDQKTLFS